MSGHWSSLAPIFPSLLSIIAIFVSLYTFNRQIVEQRRKARIDIITAQETRYLNDLVDNLVAVLVGTQRVLITFSDHDDDRLMREQIHGAEIYHFKLKIFINREPDKERVFAPMDELHRMMTRRKNERWTPDPAERDRIESLLSDIHGLGSGIVDRHVREIRTHIGDIGPDFIWLNRRNNLGG